LASHRMRSSGVVFLQVFFAIELLAVNDRSRFHRRIVALRCAAHKAPFRTVGSRSTRR
jgi:hypothetical protein